LFNRSIKELRLEIEYPVGMAPPPSAASAFARICATLSPSSDVPVAVSFKELIDPCEPEIMWASFRLTFNRSESDWPPNTPAPVLVGFTSDEPSVPGGPPAGRYASTVEAEMKLIESGVPTVTPLCPYTKRKFDARI
jgi:hypothetical protein